MAQRPWHTSAYTDHPQAEDRNKLEQLLGVARSIVADLQTGLAILSPLIASAAAAFLPH